MWTPISFLGIVAVLGVTVWTFIDPQTGAYAYILGFIALFEGWLVLLLLTARPPAVAAHVPPYNFTDEEVDYICRHPLLFRFPGTMKSFVSILGIGALAGFVLSIWLSFKGQWIEAAVILVNAFFVGSYLTRRLHPESYYATAAAKGYHEQASEGKVFASTWEKILNARHH
jgi:hypothetical protein